MTRLSPVKLLAALCLTAPVSAVPIKPVWDLRFMGGQHFFEGTASSLGGNIDFTYTPVMALKPKWTLYPTYMGSYQGTRDVQELAGGGTLFQDSMGHAVLIKSVHQAGESWKIKPSLGARYNLLRETKDEDWGDGLFDYQKFSGGLEGEWSRSKETGGRLAYDYYQLTFPNYQSLESASDPTLARELAGENVLDSANHMVTLGFWLPLPSEGRLETSFVFNKRGYDDQPLVRPDGGLEGTERQDTAMTLGAQMSYPLTFGDRLRGAGELGLSVGTQDSNQNHYDARKAVFIPDYYNHTQFSVAPRFTAAFGERPWILSLGAGYERRAYADRPVQDGEGNYLSEKLNMSVINTQISVAYPVSKNMRLRFQTSWAWSDSNMQYEKVFRYNYKIANYMMGFSYEY